MLFPTIAPCTSGDDCCTYCDPYSGWTCTDQTSACVETGSKFEPYHDFHSVRLLVLLYTNIFFLQRSLPWARTTAVARLSTRLASALKNHLQRSFNLYIFRPRIDFNLRFSKPLKATAESVLPFPSLCHHNYRCRVTARSSRPQVYNWLSPGVQNKTNPCR